MLRSCFSVLSLGAVLVCPTVAPAQGHPHHGGYSPGYHVDHHNHSIQDSHGHVIGRYHHDVVHANSTYVVPHTSHGSHHGTYYHRDNGYYYVPQTATQQTTYKPVAVDFGGFSHTDDLASRLETLSNDLCLDLHYNYRHNPGFRETYDEAYQIFEVAKFIHAAEHQQDRKAMQERLQGLDEQFHHVQDDVRGWSRHHVRQIGDLGILSKMDMVESTLHHLMNDVGVQQGGSVQQAPPPSLNGGVEQAPPPSTLP